MKIINAYSLEDAWIKSCRHVFKQGIEHEDSGDLLREYLNLTVKIENSFDVDHERYFKYFDHETYDQVISIYQPGGRIYHGRSYYQRIYDYDGVDQVKKVQTMLHKNPLTKSATIVLSDPDKDEMHIPCIMDINFKVRQEKLHMTLVFKSSDLPKKLIPDIYSISRVHAGLARNLNIARGSIYLFIMSAQIHSPDYSTVEKLIKEDVKKYYDSNAVVKNWDEEAEDWDENIKKDDHYVNIEDGYQKFIEFMNSHLDDINTEKDDVILDLGCGTGEITKLLKDRSNKVVGLDISEDMIEVARSKDIDASFVVANALDIPFNDNEFAAVVSRGILVSHTGKDYYADYLQEVSRVIKPKGVFIFDYLANTNKDEKKLRKNKAIFNKKDIKQLLKKTGFENIDISGSDSSRVHRVFCVRDNN